MAEATEPFIVIVRAHAREGQVDAAVRALETIAAPTRANPDCLEFRAFQSTDDERWFTLVERWTSLEAVLAHGKSDYMAEYEATKDLIFDTLDGEFMRELASDRAGPSTPGR